MARAASRHIELERKFSVPESAPTPCFEHMGEPLARSERLPTQFLEATYFDTPGHDLAANRITLRRRTGGTDSGWHLKLPAAGGADPGARTELHAPLSPELPDELRDTVLAIVRDRPLEPVARISTHRDVTVLHGLDGAPLAEFCDDRVTAGRLGGGGGDGANQQSWREWELELTDGEAQGASTLLDDLASRLLEAGAQPAQHASKLAKALGAAVPDAPASPSDPVHRAVIEQIDRLREWDRAVRAGSDDAVHQMRVTIRQIRSLLQASEGAFGLDDDSAVLSELRELASVLGVARDAEVLADRYRDALGALPPELLRGPVRERLVDGAVQRYQLGVERSLTAMRSPRYFGLLDTLDTVALSTPPPSDAGRPETIDSIYHRLRKRAKTVAHSDSDHDRDEALHRVRKAAKRLRYVAAAAGHPTMAEKAKTIQTLLGEHQDSVVSRAHLLIEAAAAHAAGEDTFTYGVLYRREHELGQRCSEELDAALKALRREVRKNRNGD